MVSLVAGGAGFIGSHLCAKLLRRGEEVICVDNFVTGRARNIARLLENSRFRLIRHDLVEPLPGLPRLSKIFHLASPASPPGYQRFPLETLRVNSEGTLRLLTRALKDQSTFVYASTSEVYGDPLEHPQREDYRGNVSSTGPRSMYDEAKRFGEAATMAFVRSHNVDARIARIFNTYGPNSDPDDGRLIPNFITQALTGRPLTVYGTGSQTRSICYVDDLVRGLVSLAETPLGPGQVINLGNPEEHTILEFAREILNLTGSLSTLVFGEPAVGDDPQRRRPDISKARELLAWEPRVSRRDGLARSIRYFAAELGIPHDGATLTSIACH